MAETSPFRDPARSSRQTANTPDVMSSMTGATSVVERVPNVWTELHHTEFGLLLDIFLDAVRRMSPGPSFIT